MEDTTVMALRSDPALQVRQQLPTPRSISVPEHFAPRAAAGRHVGTDRSVGFHELQIRVDGALGQLQSAGEVA